MMADNATEYMVETSGLAKRYGKFTAVDHLDLCVKKGEIYGLLGPNGAGKTTTIKMLCGLLKISGGEAYVTRKQLPDRRIASDIGYMPQETALYPGLTVHQNIKFFGETFGLGKREIDEREQRLLKFINLAEWRDELVGNLSGGMKHRVSLACALVHEPPLLLLDEPTVGVDPQLRAQFWRHFRQLNDEGVTGLRLVPAGSILLPKSGASTFLNHRVILDCESYVSSHLATVKAKPAYVLDAYLHYFLFTAKAQDLIQDHKYPSLKLSDIKEIQVLVPPLREQKRMVAILDEAFVGIETAIANTEKNLANARALFESYLDSLFADLDDGCEHRPLGELVTRLTNGYVGPTRGIYLRAGVPYLLARHVKNNQLKFDGKTYISAEFNNKNKKSILAHGDVLLVQSGHIGHSAVVPKEHEGHNCHAMIVITPMRDVLNGSFLSLFFNSPRAKGKFQEIRSGSTVPHLTCREVREVLVPVPHLSVQHDIAGRSAEVRDHVLNIERIYSQKLDALAELKQSLLQKAFSGELTMDKAEDVPQEAVA